MNFFKVLYGLGIVANLITCIAYVRMSGIDGGALAYAFFWMPILWISVFVIMVALLLINAKIAFNRGNWGTTVFAILICTPLPSYMLYYLIYFSTSPPNR
jgi:hypothetical protein